MQRPAASSVRTAGHQWIRNRRPLSTHRPDTPSDIRPNPQRRPAHRQQRPFTATTPAGRDLQPIVGVRRGSEVRRCFEVHDALRKSGLAEEDGAGGAEDGDDVGVLCCDVVAD
jgi:hypothetical protein